MRRAFCAALFSLLLAPLSARGDDVKETCASAAERAQSERASRKLRAARADFIECARAACPGVVRDDCTMWLRQVEAALPTIVLRARDARGQDLVDVTVDLDGARLTGKLDGAALPVDPGPHTLRFEAAGMKPVAMEILIAEGEHARAVVADLQQAPAVTAPPSSGSALPWIAFGLGAASLGGFVALEIVAHSEYSELASSCGAKQVCNPASVAPLRTKYQVAAVTLGVGLAAVAVGGVLLYVGSKDRARTQSWIRVSPLGGGALVSAGAAF